MFIESKQNGQSSQENIRTEKSVGANGEKVIVRYVPGTADKPGRIVDVRPVDKKK